MLGSDVNESIVNDLQKLPDGKVYHQGIINHLQFLKILIELLMLENKNTN